MSQRKAPTGTIISGSSRTGAIWAGTGAAMDLGWQTPPELLELPRAYWGGVIPFDAATTEENPTGAIDFATPGDNGLSFAWPRQTWVNPPYGRELKDWLLKVLEEATRGVEVIALLPAARWEQRYFQDALHRANAVTWIRKRVNFIRPSTQERVSGNPYANMFIGWNVDLARWSSTIGRAGLSQALVPLSPCPDRLEERGALP